MLQANDETVRDVSFFVVVQWKGWLEHDHSFGYCWPNYTSISTVYIPTKTAKCKDCGAAMP